MSAKWIKTKISALANDMTDGPFGSDLKMVHYTDKREARIVQLSNVGEDGWLDENIKYTSFSHAHEIGRCIIEPGNIIIAKMMPAGRAILCPNHEPMFVQGSDVVKIVPNDRINSTFFVYMTKQNDYLKQIEKNTQGSTRARTSISKLKEITLTIPEAKETQNKLAQILSTCDTVIQNTQKTIDKYKAIKQGMMQDLFTRGLTKDGKLRPSYKEAPELYKESELGMIPKEWNVKPLGEIVNHIIGGGTPSRNNELYWNGTIPWVTVKDFSDFNPNSAQEYITQLGLKNSSSNLIQPGHLIVATRISLGKAFYYNIPVAINQDMKALSFINTDLQYMYYWFQENSFQIINKGMGSTVKGIQQTDLLKIQVILPMNQTEQIEIAKRLSSIDTTIQKEEAVLEKYKNIKTGLMARLLTPPEDAEIIDETGE